MGELFNVRCAQGRLIITDTTITIELGQLKSESLLRSSLSSVDSKIAVASFFGLGGASNITFIGKGGERLQATMIKIKEAGDIVKLLRS